MFPTLTNTKRHDPSFALLIRKLLFSSLLALDQSHILNVFFSFPQHKATGKLAFKNHSHRRSGVKIMPGLTLFCLAVMLLTALKDSRRLIQTPAETLLICTDFQWFPGVNSLANRQELFLILGATVCPHQLIKHRAALGHRHPKAKSKTATSHG